MILQFILYYCNNINIKNNIYILRYKVIIISKKKNYKKYYYKSIIH